MQDKLILKIKLSHFLCPLQKSDINNSYLLSDTDYHVIKQKYKPNPATDNYDVVFIDLFIKALKYDSMYFDKIMENIADYF